MASSFKPKPIIIWPVSLKSLPYYTLIVKLFQFFFGILYHFISLSRSSLPKFQACYTLDTKIITNWLRNPEPAPISANRLESVPPALGPWLFTTLHISFPVPPILALCNLEHPQFSGTLPLPSSCQLCSELAVSKSLYSWWFYFIPS